MSKISFSVSATNRKKRPKEINGKDYIFLSTHEFQNKILNKEFVEWEEVYEAQYYGTLKSEINRIWSQNKAVIFDVDVDGGINIKHKYKNQCLSIFIMPPSLEELKERLIKRGTETEKSLKKRLSKANSEIKKSNEFDKVIINDSIYKAIEEVKKVIEIFIK